MSQTVNIGPPDLNPHYGRGEWQYANIISNGTAVLVAKGSGVLHRVAVGVVGTLAIFYDAKEGASLTAANEIATVDLSVLGTRFSEDVAFSRGLQCVVTGGSANLTVSFKGAATTSARSFGAPGSKSAAS